MVLIIDITAPVIALSKKNCMVTTRFANTKHITIFSLVLNCTDTTVSINAITPLICDKINKI